MRLFVCPLLDASLPRQHDSNSFEYTLLSKFLSWVKPENDIDALESSPTEGVISKNLDSHSEGATIAIDVSRSEGDRRGCSSLGG